jgi:hypothetical protein
LILGIHTMSIWFLALKTGCDRSHLHQVSQQYDILNQVNNYRRHCLWRGRDVNARKPPLAAWKLVTKPKCRGGLGVLRLRLQNETLLMKNLDKFFNKAGLPWVKMIWAKYYPNGKVTDDRMKGSFWWKIILKLLPKFKGIAQILLSSRQTCGMVEC